MLINYFFFNLIHFTANNNVNWQNFIGEFIKKHFPNNNPDETYEIYQQLLILNQDFLSFFSCCCGFLDIGKILPNQNFDENHDSLNEFYENLNKIIFLEYKEQNPNIKISDDKMISIILKELKEKKIYKSLNSKKFKNNLKLLFNQCFYHEESDFCDRKKEKLEYYLKILNKIEKNTQEINKKSIIKTKYKKTILLSENYLQYKKFITLMKDYYPLLIKYELLSQLEIKKQKKYVENKSRKDYFDIAHIDFINLQPKAKHLKNYNRIISENLPLPDELGFGDVFSHDPESYIGLTLPRGTIEEKILEIESMQNKIKNSIKLIKNNSGDEEQKKIANKMLQDFYLLYKKYLLIALYNLSDDYTIYFNHYQSQLDFDENELEFCKKKVELKQNLENMHNSFIKYNLLKLEELSKTFIKSKQDRELMKKNNQKLFIFNAILEINAKKKIIMIINKIFRLIESHKLILEFYNEDPNEYLLIDYLLEMRSFFFQSIVEEFYLEEYNLQLLKNQS